MLSVPVCDDRKNHCGYITIDITGSVDQLIEICFRLWKEFVLSVPVCDDRKNHCGYITIDITGSG